MQLNINDIIKIAESVYIDYNLTIKITIIAKK